MEDSPLTNNFQLSIIHSQLSIINYQFLKQSRTGIFQQVEHILETFCTTVIGVGNVISLSKAGTKVSHATNLPFCFDRRSALFQVFDIAVVHTNDKIEIIEIAGTNGTRTMHKVVTATGGMRTHPWIGQFALMITQDTSRVSHKFIGPSCLFHQMFHYTFSRRRATDVSQADKQDTVFL